MLVEHAARGCELIRKSRQSATLKEVKKFGTSISSVKGKPGGNEVRQLGQTKIAVLVVRAFSELLAVSAASLCYPH